MPEGLLPYVLHLLSYHPDFPSSSAMEDEGDKRRCRNIAKVPRTRLDAPRWVDPGSPTPSSLRSPQNLRMVLSALTASLQDGTNNLSFLLKQVGMIDRHYDDATGAPPRRVMRPPVPAKPTISHTRRPPPPPPPHSPATHPSDAFSLFPPPTFTHTHTTRTHTHSLTHTHTHTRKPHALTHTHTHILKHTPCAPLADPDNIGLNFVTRLAIQLLNEKIKTAESVTAYPGDVHLPTDLFAERDVKRNKFGGVEDREGMEDADQAIEKVLKGKGGGGGGGGGAARSHRAAADRDRKSVV